ncbi:MAG TPA: hypothetical protein VFO37_14195 [Chitinophagaceae bacterium]|nr:hypothetical protein [Chitinophagaceae bacterium]
MKVKFLIPVVFLALLAGCDDEEKIASVEGSWQGTKAEGEVLVFGVPTGFEEEDDTFNPMLEFKPGGVVTLTHDGVPAQGTWFQDGEKLTASLDFKTEFVDLSGDYTIQTLTDTKLVLYFEKEGTYKDPDTGIEIEGTLKATLYFDKK